jgi:hypothetical protein
MARRVCRGAIPALRILEPRVLDLNIEVTATVVADQVRADILVAGALRRVGLVRKAAEKGLGYTPFEVRAGIHYLLAQARRKFLVTDAEHIQTNAVVEQLDFQRFIGRDAGRGVQRDCGGLNIAEVAFYSVLVLVIMLLSFYVPVVPENSIR